MNKLFRPYLVKFMVVYLNDVVVYNNTLRMDEVKVKTIHEWQVPTKVFELHSFLGFVDYYRRFMKGYSSRVAPLMDLLKKNMG